MEKGPGYEEIGRLKAEFRRIEQAHQHERECLQRVISTFGIVVGMHGDMVEEYQAIMGLLDRPGEIPKDKIDAKIGELRSKIFARETRSMPSEVTPEQLVELREGLFTACKTIKRIMVNLLDGFYPLPDELRAHADAIRLDCNAEPLGTEIEKAAVPFLDYIRELKAKVREDFGYVNRTLLTFLGQIKDLERSLAGEFGGEISIKEIERFERRVNNEMGSIVESLNIHATISEIRTAVMEKLSNIKQLVAKRKKEELERARRAQEKIRKLKDKITQAEMDAQRMCKKAERFQMAATRDGLTSLYNRKAFDHKIAHSLRVCAKMDEPLSLILFDVDNFKWINDTFGHVAGDRVLKAVALTLRETFRKDDFIARYGGDEFAVVVEGMTKDMAKERIAKFMDAFKKKRFVSHMMKKEINVSISSGIAEAAEGDHPEALIHRADVAMYAEKKHAGAPHFSF